MCTLQIIAIIESREKNDRFLYELLGRMVNDCDYYLGCGNKCEKHLWSLSAEHHIQDMIMLYDNFSEDRKPEWLTKDMINDYALRMGVTL